MNIQYTLSSVRAKVVRNEKIHPLHVVLGVSAAEARPCRPGQFAMLRLPDPQGRSFMLSRPYSIMEEKNGSLEFLVKIVGAGSQILASLEPGREMDVLYPLGTSFADPCRYGSPVLVAGGCGVAPFLCLARAEAQRGRRLKVLYGATTRKNLVLKEELARVCDLKVSTDDGTEGARGMVSRLLEEEMRRRSFDVVLACGPAPLLGVAAQLAAGRGIECQVSVETLMGCGFGACLGCVVPRAGGGYLQACKDGPVIDARLVDWQKF
jgi:dihydroorotate dehydrogenase electron transfer subunit